MKRTWALVALILGAVIVLTELAFWFGVRASSAAVGSGTCSVVVLGYPSAPDGAPHPIQQLRVEAGVAAFRANGCDRIVLSGGAVENQHVEAVTMAEIARALGIADRHIVIEGRARSTWENIGCSAPWVAGASRVLLASDSLHVHRARRYACRQDPALCPRVFAVGANPPLALLWWKVPAAANELVTGFRDWLYFERNETGNAPVCPGRSRVPR